MVGTGPGSEASSWLRTSGRPELFAGDRGGEILLEVLAFVGEGLRLGGADAARASSMRTEMDEARVQTTLAPRGHPRIGLQRGPQRLIVISYNLLWSGERPRGRGCAEGRWLGPCAHQGLARSVPSPDQARSGTVPMHAGDVPSGTLRSIEKQAMIKLRRR